MSEIRVTTTVTVDTLTVDIAIEDTIPDPDDFIEETTMSGEVVFAPYRDLRNSAIRALTARAAVAAVAAAAPEDEEIL